MVENKKCEYEGIVDSTQAILYTAFDCKQCLNGNKNFKYCNTYRLKKLCEKYNVNSIIELVNIRKNLPEEEKNIIKWCVNELYGEFSCFS